MLFRVLINPQFLYVRCGDHYFQKCRASMGAKFPPSLANLFMGWWEKSRIFGAGCPHRPRVKLFRHYIDDLIFVCTKDVGGIDEWLLYLNDNSLNLKFTGIMDHKQNSWTWF